MLPYFYRLYFKPTGQYYVGVQYGKNAHPDNLWNKYFTSSKVVKKLISEFGLSAFSYKITKTFNTGKDATMYERRFLIKVKANKNNKFLNLSLGLKESFLAIGPCSTERRSNISKARLETKKISCPHCEKVVDPGNFKAWHGDKCKKNPNIDPKVLDTRRNIAKSRYIANSVPAVINLKAIKKCEFCLQSFSLSNYSKYHGSKCLKNPNISVEDLEYREKLNNQLSKARLAIRTHI